MRAYHLAFLLLLAPAVEAKEVITWLQADLKPYYFQHGVHQGTGALESAQQILISALPQYQHNKEWMTLVRREQALRQTQGIVCTFSMLKTVERNTLQFSQAVAAAPGYAIVTPALGTFYQRWLAQAPVNLVDWLKQQVDFVGLLEAGRAKPDFIRPLDAGSIITFPLQTNPVALLAHGRADYWLEYSDRANYLLSEYQAQPQDLRFIYVQPQQVSLSYVACSPATPESVMQDINATLNAVLVQPAYQQALYKWNDNDTRQQLLTLYRNVILTDQAQSQF